MDERLTDDELEALLVARAERAHADHEELTRAVSGRIAGERQDGPGWVTPRLLRGRRQFGWVASVAAALAVGIAIGLLGPGLLRSHRPDTAASGVPRRTTAASAVPTGGAIDLTHVLSAEELGAALVEGRVPAGSIVLVDTALPLEPCRDTGLCIDAAREGIPGAVVAIQSPVPEARSIRAVTVSGDVDADGRVVLRLVAHDIQVGPGGEPWTVDTLAASAQEPGSVYAVQGWLAELPPFRCPLVTNRTPLIRVCGPVSSYLTPVAYQAARPQSGGIGVVAPDIAIGVGAGDYGQFAPEPAMDENGFSVPREGVYLVEIETPGELPLGRILGRVGAAATPAPTAVSMTAEALARDIAGRDGRIVIVRGIMEPVPLPCQSAADDCTGGRLVGYDGPPILPDASLRETWTGEAAGYLAFSVNGPQLTYLGPVGTDGDSIRPSRPSLLSGFLQAGDLELVEGELVDGCRDVPDCTSFGMRDIASDDILQPVGHASWARPTAGRGLFLLRRLPPGVDPCPAPSGETRICFGTLRLAWEFVGWVTEPTPVPATTRE